MGRGVRQGGGLSHWGFARGPPKGKGASLHAAALGQRMKRKDVLAYASLREYARAHMHTRTHIHYVPKGAPTRALSAEADCLCAFPLRKYPRKHKQLKTHTLA